MFPSDRKTAFAPPLLFAGSSATLAAACGTTRRNLPAQIARKSSYQNSGVQRTTIRAQVTLAQTIRRAVENEFPGKDISRVLKSFDDVLSDAELEVGKGTPRHQKASSFIEGLDAVPFYDDFTSAESKLKWVKHLEHNWEIIANELKTVTSIRDIQTRGNNIWVPPVIEAATTYGPDWRTLVLQDRVWDPVNSKLFPETVRVLRDKEVNVPSVEAFFAKQAPKTGIKLHTDFCNFILTMHLGLDTPENKSWIEVGGERRYWQNGKALVFNTSFFHQTMNESEDQERYVLLIRFWHPELTQIERQALSLLFALIDNPDSHPATVKAEAQLRDESQRAKVKNRKSQSGGRGFAR